MIKKKLFLITFFMILPLIFAFADSALLSSEMISAYKSGFYPGVVRYADEILKEDSTSIFAGRALVYKGESLFRIGRVDEALFVLDGASSSVADNKELNSARLYWIGRGLASKNFHESALNYFYKAAELSKSSKEINTTYAQSIYYSAVSCYATKNYVQAADLYNFVLANGIFFGQIEYEQAICSFFESCINSGQYSRACEYATLLSDKNLSEQTKYRILLYEAQALEGNKNYASSYQKYCEVLAEAPSELAAIAMQKAYSVSSEHQNEVKEEPGNIIKKAEPRLSAYPQLVSEFWTRLALDSFNAKNYEKSLLYFDNAKKDAPQNLLQIALIYRTEIDFINSTKSGGETERVNSAQKAYDSLKENLQQYGFDENSPYLSDYELALIRYSGLSENWDSCIEVASKYTDEKTPFDQRRTAIYWKAYSLYRKENYKDSCALLDSYSYADDVGFASIHARVLAKTGRSSEADKIFYNLLQRQKLDNEGRLDYARTLLNAGHLISTVEQTSYATGSQALYMKGLAFFNRRRWADSEENFEKALSLKTLEKKYSDYARFYLGYSQYQLGKSAKAYENLSTFASSSQMLPLMWESCITASRAAVQAGRYKDAVKMAEKALSTAKNENQKQESVLLYAGVYNDGGEYDKAITVLRPYTTGKNEFAFECRYLTAQILVQKKDYELADKTYAELSEEKSAGELAEEAAYRRGELSYTTEKYSQALTLFESYAKKYYKGQFYFASLYFAADSLVKTGEKEKALLYYNQIVKSPENSTYKYGAEKQMIELYRNSGQYNLALETAQKLVEEYGDQASKDGIPEEIRELKALAKGADSKLVLEEKEYNDKGGILTVQGRKIGTKLANSYCSSSDTAEKGEKLALQLLEKQKANDEESPYALQNALLLAGIYRTRGQNEKSAKMYLDATEYARKSGEDEKAARALYGGAEAFDAAGLYGDAKSTVELLKQLYPNSKQAKDATSLIK